MKKMIVGNLKMNLISKDERVKYFEDFKNEVLNMNLMKSKIVLCVPGVHLEAFAEIKTENIFIGAQNIFWQDKGSFTGEISAPMVKNLGGEYVIIGHSERRKYFSETSVDANLKIKAALKNNLVPIYCIGETIEEKNEGNTAQIVMEQIMEGFADLTSDQVQKIVIAYEPVWAVGSDKIPTGDEILQVKILLKKIFTEKYGAVAAEKIKILYGGSVKAEIIKQVCLEPGLDGVLVGRESLNPKDFLNIVKEIENN